MYKLNYYSFVTFKIPKYKSEIAYLLTPFYKESNNNDVQNTRNGLHYNRIKQRYILEDILFLLNHVPL